jgi:hypothetical protein
MINKPVVGMRVYHALPHFPPNYVEEYVIDRVTKNYIWCKRASSNALVKGANYRYELDYEPLFDNLRDAIVYNLSCVELWIRNNETHKERLQSIINQIDD